MTGRHLLRHEAEPGGKVASFGKTAPLAMATTIALAMSGPIPGTVISCRQASR